MPRNKKSLILHAYSEIPHEKIFVAEVAKLRGGLRIYAHVYVAPVE